MNKGTDIKNINNDGDKNPPEKKSFFTRVYDRYHKVVLDVKSTKGGRAIIRLSKGAAIALGLYGTYKLGQKSVTPVTLYIEPTEPEVQEEEPEQAEEANEEEPEQEQE